jgi:hypothetical protein
MPSASGSRACKPSSGCARPATPSPGRSARASRAGRGRRPPPNDPKSVRRVRVRESLSSDAGRRDRSHNHRDVQGRPAGGPASRLRWAKVARRSLSMRPTMRARVATASRAGSRAVDPRCTRSCTASSARASASWRLRAKRLAKSGARRRARARPLSSFRPPARRARSAISRPGARAGRRDPQAPETTCRRLTAARMRCVRACKRAVASTFAAGARAA